MALTTVSLLGLLALSNAAVLERYDPRIVNGEDAAPGEIPYQVSLQVTGSGFHFCGGSVLNRNYVITAAHCVDGKTAAGVTVVAGTVDLNKPQSIHRAASIYIHEGYNPRNSWINDIALIKVDAPFIETKQISFVALPDAGQTVDANALAVVSGWGRLWQGGATTKHLQRVNIYIADQDYCKKMYNSMSYAIHEGHICAFDPTSQKGSCNGDSGGPLTVNGKLVGLVSWAKACALTDYPTVYTRVANYIGWIEQHAV